MKNLNLQKDQVYKIFDNAYVKLLQPTGKGHNPYVYDKDGSFKCWDVEWYDFENGKLVLRPLQTTMRMDGFGGPELVDCLPSHRKFYLRSNPLVTGGGCDGHRYSSQEIVLTDTNEIAGVLSWEEYRGYCVTIKDKIYYPGVVKSKDVDIFINNLLITTD